MSKSTLHRAIITIALAASLVFVAALVREVESPDAAPGAEPASAFPPAQRPGTIVTREVGGVLAQASPSVAPELRLSLAQELRHVRSLDQSALDELKVKVSRWIKEDLSGFESEFLGQLQNSDALDLAFGVFGINQLAESNRLSAPILRAVLDLKSDIEPTQIELLQIHSLSMIRKLQGSARARLADDSRLMRQLVEVAQTASNLAIVREAMLGFRVLGDKLSREELTKIAELRPAHDRFAYADLLAGD